MQLLEENQALFREPMQGELQRELRELGKNVEQWPGACPERWQIVARVQLLLPRAVDEELGETEQLLNQIEARLTPDFFAPCTRREGRIISPLEAKRALDSAIVSLPLSSLHCMDNSPWGEAQFLINKSFCLLLRSLTKMNFIPQEPFEKIDKAYPGKELSQRRFEQIREMVRTTTFPPIESLYVQSPCIPPEIALFTISDLTICEVPAHLPEAIGTIRCLKSLTIANLKKFPTQILSLRKLTRLVLRNGEFEALPKEFAKLKKLESLTLCDVKLFGFPTVVTNQTRLRELSLLNLYSSFGFKANLNNKITAIPSQISRLTNLKELHLSGNFLEQVAVEIERCTALRELCCDTRDLHLFPQTLLKRLDEEHTHPSYIK